MSTRRRRTSDPVGLWFAQAQLAQELAFTSASAALVMTSRLTTLAIEGANPTPAGRREAERMVTEKAFAAYDGAAAAMRRAGQHALAGTLHTPEAAVTIADAATRPMRRAVRNNARRLTRG